MNTNRACGCKSFRTCILCEIEFGLKSSLLQELDEKLEQGKVFHYCFKTGECIEESDDKDEEEKTRLKFPGIHIVPDFLSKDEEKVLVEELDTLPWDSSQSGRRKQNFGPRANFNKRKAKVGQNFAGFPSCSKFLQDRFSRVPLLEGYKTVEQCSIEYRPETGASIEPHIDDCWIWGERVVQVNLLSPTYLTLTPFPFNKAGNSSKYNLSDVSTYPKVVDNNSVVFNPFLDKTENCTPFDLSAQSMFPENSVVKIPLPPRSLLVMYGQSRYSWEHMVLRSDISQRRVVIAYRELTPPYLPGGKEEGVGREILDKAALFW